MDKDELKIFVKQKKPLFLTITGVALIMFLIFCIFGGLGDRDNSGEKMENGGWITVEELEQSGLCLLYTSRCV